MSSAGNDVFFSVLFNDAFNTRGYLALSIDERMSTEHLWDDIDRILLKFHLVQQKS